MSDKDGCLARNRGIFDEYPVYFASGSDDISFGESRQLPVILEIAKREVNNKGGTMELTAYADECTDERSSVVLGAQRILAVEQYLSANGISINAITKRLSLGNTDPIENKLETTRPACESKANNQVAVRFRSADRKN